MNTPLHDRLSLIENPESRLACVILVDVSNSMTGKPITEVNNGIIKLGQHIEEDELTSMRADIAIIAFNHQHQIVREFGEHTDYSHPDLQASGGTRMAEPLTTALDMVEHRKSQYRAAGIPYYRPIVMLITDGHPEHDTETEIDAIAQRIKAAEASRSLTFFAIGTESADMDTLAKLSNLTPKTLQGTNFDELFRWLSNSIAAISNSQMGDDVTLPSTDGWSKY